MLIALRLIAEWVLFKYKVNKTHKFNVIFYKTVNKVGTILTKCFFPYLNPTSYLNKW